MVLGGYLDTDHVDTKNLSGYLEQTVTHLTKNDYHLLQPRVNVKDVLTREWFRAAIELDQHSLRTKFQNLPFHRMFIQAVSYLTFSKIYQHNIIAYEV